MSGSEAECEAMEAGPERYACMLRERGIKATTQRIMILGYLDGNEEHPTVERIHSDLRHDAPTLSKTTVYNTLQLLHGAGLVDVLTISGTEGRYELAHGMHHHLLCKACGTVYDIDVSCPYLGGMLDGEHKIDEVHGYFKGTCRHCLEAARDSDNKEEE